MRNRTITKIRTFGDPILKQVCEPVAAYEDARKIIAKMRGVLLGSKTGVGLAAPQIGHAKRIIMAKISGEFVAMVNPVMLLHQGHLESGKEGCLSYPGIIAKIDRWSECDIEFTDEDGNLLVAVLAGFEARIVQHELDHLEGKCIVGKGF